MLLSLLLTRLLLFFCFNLLHFETISLENCSTQQHTPLQATAFFSIIEIIVMLYIIGIIATGVLLLLLSLQLSATAGQMQKIDAGCSVSSRGNWNGPVICNEMDLAHHAVYHFRMMILSIIPITLNQLFTGIHRQLEILKY
jgi:hypothetical protein